ncbi:MAG: LysM peptidoglycan-binding domain-containing protein [Deltaproteobacteria bacterium]
MGKIFRQAFILCFLSIFLFYSQALSSNEDTAQLTFSKTAVSKKYFQNYTVQKGDVLSAIVRRLPGITEKDIPRYYEMTKELNPDIADLDRLYEGQTIRLPGKSPATSETPAPALAASGTEDAGSQAYRVKKGDSLIRIVHRELRISSRTQNILLEIKALNPGIKDVHKIYIGQIIRLPEGQTAAKASFAVTVKKDVAPAGEKVQVLTPQDESSSQDTKDGTAKESIALPPAERMAVVKHIITQMNGSMITNGNYYLPVSRTEQLTIDCSVIPVVELDQKTTIFLDLENRSSQPLKKIISDNWKNYHLVKIDDKDDVIVMLKKIFRMTKTYELTKAQQPVCIGTLPPLEVLVDWIIIRKDAKNSPPINQGLRFVYENNALLPRAIVNYARRYSWIITEISPEKGLVAKPEEIYSLPPVAVLPTTSARDFSYALLSYLDIQGEKDVDVRVFNIEKDGFNLSIKADIAVTRGEKKILIFSRNLPPQFTAILQKSGNELIFISDQDDPAKNMEKILHGFQFVFTSGYFTFSGLDKNQPPYSFGFNGTKIKTEKSFYVVNFDFNQELRGLMQETWSAGIVRY